MPGQERRPNPQRRRRRRRRINYTAIIFWLVVVLVVVGSVAIIMSITGRDNDSKGSKGGSKTTNPTKITIPYTDPTEGSTGPELPPPVTKVSTATVGATGDVLMHMPCVRPALQSDGTYNFSPYFAKFSSYVQSVDYAVANLETTLAGRDYERWVNGEKVTGYYGVPSLNTPDEIIPNLQSAGFDMLLTANNHTYDTGTTGFHRTQQILAQNAMDYTGTRTDVEADNYLIKNINGIQIGMICYTYETNSDPDKVALNGITMNATDKNLVNVFLKDDVAGFSADLAENIADMEADGAEAIVLYIHWGEEYQTKQNNQQKAVAQAACDLGVDVIVGGHPHVIQPMDLLTSSTDDSHKTVCLYSTGNAMSNQRLGNISYVHTAHTEDGIFFSFTFAKYSDGTVRVEEVEALPLWVNMHSSTGKTVYDILPLDKDVADWKAAYNLTSNTLTKANDSYERTMKIIGAGLEKIQTYLDSLPEVA